ncbi:MAG TPA: YfhO family protein, partial [Acidimicrobiales bacterium]|nr:YfhO family protein [Acidimicrobiales bacterium]
PTQAPQYTLTGSAGGVRVFENNGRTPRAFVTAEVHEVGGMAGAVSYLTSLGHTTEDGTTHVDLFDPLHQAVVEVPAGRGTAPPPLPEAPAEPRPARIVSYRAERVEVEVPPGVPGLLVLTDSYFPGWEATVNGRPAPVLPTDVAFRGVMLGSGDSRVVLTYHAPGGNLGWGIPALAIMCFGAIALFRRRNLHD